MNQDIEYIYGDFHNIGKVVEASTAPIEYDYTNIFSDMYSLFKKSLYNKMTEKECNTWFGITKEEYWDKIQDQKNTILSYLPLSKESFFFIKHIMSDIEFEDIYDISKDDLLKKSIEASYEEIKIDQMIP